MSSRKRRRASMAEAQPEAAPPAPARALALPSDLVLEIVARSDAATLVRCAACCKPLRREILSPAFIGRVCHGPDAVVPPRLLGLLQSLHYLAAYSASQPPPPLSVAYPATPAAARLAEEHLAPFVSHGGAADLLARYEAVTSRGGLVVLCGRRQYIHVPLVSSICVYDPMTGDRVFLPDPPNDVGYYCGSGAYVLLTASDGIGCSSLLLAVDFMKLKSSESYIEVRTVSLDDGGRKWSVATSSTSHRRSHRCYLHPDCSSVVLGGSIHWAMIGGRDHDRRMHILTYNIRTEVVGSIELPVEDLPEEYRNYSYINICLASSPDGRLTMLVSESLKITVWLLSPSGADWARHAVIDAEAPLRSVVPELPHAFRLESWAERSGFVLFTLVKDNEGQGLIAIDLKTKEMHMVKKHRRIRVFPFEVDLESRLSAMKIFQ